MPVVVTGTGRCGSSAVARVLHEQLGVHMGDRFDRIRPPNPEGTYEDLDFRDLHVALGRGELEREEFEGRARALIAARNAEHGERWGFKDPRASHLLDFYIRAIPDALIVIPYRDPTTVTRSIHRHYGTPEQQGARESEARLEAIESALAWRFGSTVAEATTYAMRRGRSTHAPGPALAVNMDQRRSDEWLAELLRPASTPPAAAR